MRCILQMGVVAGMFCASCSRPGSGNGAPQQQHTSDSEDSLEMHAEQWRIDREFAGKIIEVVLLSRYEGKVRLGHFDPHWVVLVEETREEKPGMSREQREVSAYAIHSPTKVFGIPADRLAGKMYRFTMHSRVRPDDTTRWLLTARPIGQGDIRE